MAALKRLAGGGKVGRMSGPEPRVWMDGFGLSIVGGTGIATYARGLAAALASGGHGLGLLYGRPIPAGGEAMAREIAFFDSQTRLRRPLASRLLGIWGRQRAEPVPETGAVERTLHSAGLHGVFSPAEVPPGAALWNANDLFGRAVVHMRVRRRPLAVHAPSPPAVMHWSHLHALSLAGARNLYTIHDAIPLRLPWAALDNKGVWLAAARAVAARADHIVTVSEHARRDLIALLGIPDSRITNTYQSVAPSADALPEAMSRARLAASFGLEPRGYHLSLASVDPRKNLARLLDAYASTTIARPLILVGGKSANAAPELRLLTEAGGTQSRDGRVRHLGYLPRADVEVLVRHARSLLFPSLYEGFGLPAVEAMLAGTAVIASDAAALPEVLGDAALLVPPTDTRALAEAIIAVDSDDALRARLEAAGPPRAALYSPERHRARLAGVYARLGLPFTEEPA